MVKARLGWLTGSILVVTVMALPIIGVLAGLFSPLNDTWRHIQKYLLADYLIQTAILTIGSVTCGIILASLLAWFVTAYRFTGSRFLAVALVMPLAIPPYIGGYTYASMTGYTGPIQVFLRNRVGWTPPPGFLDMMNMRGAIIVFTLFLYPYIYLVVRGFLDRQAGQLVEASRMLGASRTRTYFKVIVPLTRNAVVAGSTLMAFEVLSDYGVVSHFGLNVFTTAIFKSWLGLNDIAAALKLAAILLVVVTAVSMGEKALRGRRSHSYASARVTPLTPVAPTGWRKIVVPLVCWGTFAVALVIPMAQMIWWAFLSWDNIRRTGIFSAFGMTLGVALAGALLTTLCALIVAQHQRIWPTPLSKTLARITVIGYSIPSTVIALSILSIMVWLSEKTPLPLVMTPSLIVLAYLIRYLAVSMQPMESGFERIGTRFTEASRMLGHGPTATLARVDLPMMKTALAGAFLLAFIDMVKELPIVLILRPFNFSTLSTTVFQYANDEQIPESSLASLLIIALAFVPVLLLVARGNTTDKKEHPAP
ncbi:ABC transporter permease [Corynebacterium mendelii]|uniref:Iron ABC transporter permease n=1 Tax=Corynebacterium mendelii TaxID=2765362 RepID=A0A939IVL2_9CORY|nr:iron ABC transporter permease [Corynebacterium mendelii]MBN9644346.1 iron ABC transporter permease [Corynebacterium mendelii]